MFHGGTNWGFMNGANVLDTLPFYAPDVASYGKNILSLHLCQEKLMISSVGYYNLYLYFSYYYFQIMMPHCQSVEITQKNTFPQF
jgi:hypothetical protein